MTAVIALLLAAVFGAADQYLGSFSVHPWAADASLLSAPWLVVPFLAGWAQRTPLQATLTGLACTFSALLGYGLMTLSPVEGAELTTQAVRGLVVSSSPVVAGGFLTGPLFGWCGYRWGTRRAWRGALAVAAAVCLEPLVRLPVDSPIRFRTVWMAEIAVGLAMATYVVVGSRRRSRSLRRA